MKYIITEKQLANLNKKNPITESILKMGELMYYDSEKTATENKGAINEQMGLQLWYLWKARQAAKRAKKNTDPNQNIEPNQSIEPKIYTDHDRVWDYKIENNMWYTRRKTSNGNWVSLKNYPAAIQKLNNFYGTSIGSTNTTSSTSAGGGGGSW